jgi:hypothetical protein
LHTYRLYLNNQGLRWLIFEIEADSEADALAFWLQQVGSQYPLDGRDGAICNAIERIELVKRG